MALPNLPSPGRAAWPATLVGIVAAVGAGVVAVALGLQLRQVRQALGESRKEVTQLRGENTQLQQKIEGLQQERIDLEQQRAALRTELSSVSGDLEGSRSSLEEVKANAARLDEERARLASEVARLTSERDVAHERFAFLERERDELQRSAARVRERLLLLDRDYRQAVERIAQLEASPAPGLNVVRSVSSPAGSVPQPLDALASLSSIPGTVELPPIIVRKDNAGMSAPIRGRVAEVNAEHQFVVIDRGSEDGVRPGMVFDVLRGTHHVGRVMVARVRPQLSACDIVQADTPGLLQVGDAAVQDGP